MFVKIKSTIISLFAAPCKVVDIRDFFVFGGLAMVGSGLGMFLPWLGLSVSGALLMALGLGWLTRKVGK